MESITYVLDVRTFIQYFRSKKKIILVKIGKHTISLMIEPIVKSVTFKWCPKVIKFAMNLVYGIKYMKSNIIIIPLNHYEFISQLIGVNLTEYQL